MEQPAVFACYVAMIARRTERRRVPTATDVASGGHARPKTLSPSLEVRAKLRERESIEDALFWNATFARHQHSPPHVVDLAGRVRVGINAEEASQLKPALAPSPVHIQPPGMCVDLDCHAVLGTGTQDALHIDLIAGPTEQLAPRNVAQNSRVRIFDRLDDPVRLLLPAEAELAMNAADDKVEASQYFFRVIERTVDEDVGNSMPLKTWKLRP